MERYEVVYLHVAADEAIAYRVRDGLVEITNIFHGGRDYEALYRNASGE